MASWVRGSQDGVQYRPSTPQSLGLPFDLGGQLVELGPGQLVDPGQQIGLAVIDGQSGPSVGHGVVDESHGDQLPEEHADEGAARQGGGEGPLAEPTVSHVFRTGQDPMQPVLGHQHRDLRGSRLFPHRPVLIRDLIAGAGRVRPVPPVGAGP